MSGILASTMRENRFRIRLEYLKRWKEVGLLIKVTELDKLHLP